MCEYATGPMSVGVGDYVTPLTYYTSISDQWPTTCLPIGQFVKH